MRICFFPSDQSGCGYVRMRLPARALAERGHEVAVINHCLIADEHFDVFVFQRVALEVQLEVMRHLVGLGKVVVHDMDDAYDAITPHNPARHAYPPEVIKRIEEAMRIATFCTVTTPELRGRIKYLANDVVVLPNYVDTGTFYHANPTRDYGIVVGWAGTPTHNGDLQILRGVLETLERDYENVSFYMAGGTPPPGTFKVERMLTRQLQEISTYPELLAPIHIGIVPLEMNDFNLCKSNIKGVEMSAAGIPFVASPTPAYERMAKVNPGCVLACRPKEWIREIRKLIEDPELRRERGQAARAYAETMDIGKNIYLWEDAYGSHIKGGEPASADERSDKVFV